MSFFFNEFCQIRLICQKYGLCFRPKEDFDLFKVRHLHKAEFIFLAYGMEKIYSLKLSNFCPLEAKTGLIEVWFKNQDDLPRHEIGLRKKATNSKFLDPNEEVCFGFDAAPTSQSNCMLFRQVFTNLLLYFRILLMLCKNL